jgi:hypothetical protein
MEQMYGEMFKLWGFSWDSYKNNFAFMQQQAEKMMELFSNQTRSQYQGGIMEQMYGEMFKLWRSSWETYKSNLAFMQQQAEKMMELFFSQTLPEGVQKNMKDVLATAQKAQESYIQAMEEAFQRMEDLMAKSG